MKQALFSALAVGLLATPDSTPVDCGGCYVSFLERVSQHAPSLSGDRLAALHRGGLRIFDACDSGHLGDVQARFAELEHRLGAPANRR
jgi:hypothetical protein